MLIFPTGQREQLVGHGGMVSSVYRPMSHSVQTPASETYVPATHTMVGTNDGSGVGAVVVGSEVGPDEGKSVGRVVGLHVVSERTSQHVEPNELPVEMEKPDTTVLERA